MSKLKVGLAICGSFCTFSKILVELERLCEFYDITPILSEASAGTDTRFGAADKFRERVEAICGRAAVTSITEAEPIGPKGLLDVIAVAPCTGNTLAKLAAGVTDTSVTMACKAHLRNGRPVVIAISTNDGLSISCTNIGALLARKNYYFVPFAQDAPEDKPCSLVADFSKLREAIDAAAEGRQLQPVLC